MQPGAPLDSNCGRPQMSRTDKQHKMPQKCKAVANNHGAQPPSQKYNFSSVRALLGREGSKAKTLSNRATTESKIGLLFSSFARKLRQSDLLSPWKQDNPRKDQNFADPKARVSTHDRSARNPKLKRYDGKSTKALLSQCKDMAVVASEREREREYLGPTAALQGRQEKQQRSGGFRARFGDEHTIFSKIYMEYGRKHLTKWPPLFVFITWTACPFSKVFF